MGADIEELDDGLAVRRSRLTGNTVEGHSDHRVVMSRAIAGLCAEGSTVITDAEAASVTFPEFAEIARACGGDLE
jgi:3-phosphoshikimate 1-carboxyvinyltransferase